MNDVVSKDKEYKRLLSTIGEQLVSGRAQATQKVNNILIETYWNIGKHIVEFEQGGEEKAEYGSQLLVKLSKDLKLTYGKGFSRSNLQYMRLLYSYYPIRQTVSGKLSWSHYTELLSISNELARSFYEKQCVKENLECSRASAPAKHGSI